MGVFKKIERGIRHGFKDLTGQTAAEEAKEASKQASQAQMSAQKEALDYLKEQQKLPTEIRDKALKDLQASYSEQAAKFGFDPSDPYYQQVSEAANRYMDLVQDTYGRAEDLASESYGREQEIAQQAYDAQLAALGQMTQEGIETARGEAAATGGVRGGSYQDVLQDIAEHQNVQQRQLQAQRGQALLDAERRRREAIQQAQAQRQQALFGAETQRLQALQGARGSQLDEFRVNQQLAQNRLQGISGLAQLPTNANNIANLMQGIGQTQAQGIVGAAQSAAAARQMGMQNLMNLGALGGMIAFSDRRLKDNIKKISDTSHPDIKVYSWTWNDKAAKLGLEGQDSGYIAQEVKMVWPELVSEKDGYLQINKSEITRRLNK